MKKKINFEVGDDSSLYIKGSGDVAIQLKLLSKKVVRRKLKNVIYVPKLVHKLPKTFQAEALSTANCVLNRSPSTALNSRIPCKMFNGYTPNVQYFEVFDSNSFIHVPKNKRSKLDFKSNICIFLGYGNNRKGFQIYNQQSKRIIYTRDIIFNESKCI